LGRSDLAQQIRFARGDFVRASADDCLVGDSGSHCRSEHLRVSGRWLR
jgi:hypothetical protein